MVTVVVVADGAADPLGAGPTCLEEAATPALDRILATGALARARTIPDGLAPGTEVGLPSVLGVELSTTPARGLIEAAAAGVSLEPGEGAWRLDVVPRGAPDAHALARLAAVLAPLGARVHHLGGHRLLLIGPADWGAAPAGPHQTALALSRLARGPFADVVGAGVAALSRTPAAVGSAAWPWGADPQVPGLPDLPALLGRDVALVADGGAAAGIGRLLGCDVVLGPPARAVDLVDAAAGDSVVVVHCAAPDEAAHARDRAAKIAAIEDIDRQVVGPLSAVLERRGGSLIVTPDHGCDSATGRHIGDAVPAALWSSKKRSSTAARRLTERAVRRLPAVAAPALLPRQIRLGEQAA